MAHKYVQISYYIPTRNEPANRLANNMRAMLRRRAMHFDGSCWIMREDQVPHVMMHEMETLGAEVFVTPPFEESGTGVLNEMAVRCLIRDLNERLESMGVASDDAEAELAAVSAEVGDTREAKIKKYKTRCRAAVRRMEKYLEETVAAAENMGFAIGSAADLISTARNAAGALQSNFSARAAAYAAAALTIEDGAMREVALADEILPEVLHDMLVDTGKEAEAEELAKTFGFPGVVYAPAETVEYQEEEELEECYAD